MKKYLSVVSLPARVSFGKLLSILIAMTLVQGGAFWFVLQRGPVAQSFSLEFVLEESLQKWIFGAGFLAFYAALAMSLFRTGSRQNYTLMRLAVPAKGVFWLQCAYNAACLLLFWAWELCAVFGLCALYARLAPADYVSAQSVFLAFYRNDFLHSLLPFEDALRWVQNVFLVAGLSICAARRPQNRMKAQNVAFSMPLAAVAFFVRPLGDDVSPVFAIGLAILCAGVCLYQNLSEDVYEKA